MSCIVYYYDKSMATVCPQGADPAATGRQEPRTRDGVRSSAWPVRCIAIVSAGLTCLWAPPLGAQVDVIEDTERQRQQRQLEIERTNRDAAEQAAARRALETREDVTYEQVLADPDNLDLNFRYAKVQIARGDFVGASATLERLLMLKADLPRVRLFYALVLFHLDNLEDAQRELAQLQEEQLPPEQWREAQQLTRQIRQRQRRTHLTGTTSVGFGYDTNRNASPSSKHRLFSDAQLDVAGTTRRRNDTHLLVVNSLGVTHELGRRSGHQFMATASHFLGEQTNVDDLDLQSFSGEVGVAFNTPVGTITPTGFADYLFLGRESFLKSQGTRLRTAHPVGERLLVTAEGRWTQENYRAITENTAAPERTGDRVNAILGTRFALTPTMQVGLEGGYENKAIDGEPEFNAYEGGSVTGSHTWLLGKGQFLLSAVTFGVNVYDEPDLAIASRRRRDEQFRARMTYGAPVSLLLGEWPALGFLTDNLSATASIEQFRSHSNVTNYTYSDTKLDLLLTKRVDF